MENLKEEFKNNMKEIKKAIEKWVKKNKRDVCFIGTFISLKKGSDCENGLSVAFGERGAIKICLSELNTQLKADKEEFINW